MQPLTKTENRPSAPSNEVSRVNYVTPLANILDSSDGYVLEAEMPGVDKEGLEITVENGELTILGRRKAYKTKGQTLYRESRPADFRRVFEIDPSIDSGKITARIDQGILVLHLPKAESVKPRQITVE